MVTRKSALLLLIICLILCVGIIQGQTAYNTYTWNDGDFTLLYPAQWDTPSPVAMEDGSLILQVAQALAASPEARPPAIPFITLKRIAIPLEFEDLSTLLQAELSAIGISLTAGQEIELLGLEGVQIDGFSEDQLFYGLAQGTILQNGTEMLLVIGRSANLQRDSFRAVFEILVENLAEGSDILLDTPSYGLLWHTERLLDSGETAFLDTAALTLDTDNQFLYLVDNLNGIYVMSADNGTVLDIFSFEDGRGEAGVTDATFAPDGTLYISDVICACVRVWRDGEWQDAITGYGETAPQSLATTVDGTLYSTDFQDARSFLRSINGEIALPEDATDEQPLLATDRDGNLLILTPFGVLYRLEGENIVPLFNVPTADFIVDFAVDAENNLIIITETDGIIVLNAAGDELYRPGEAATLDVPFPGELLNPADVTVDNTGTIYWTDSDGFYGNVTAMSLSVEGNRRGSSTLQSGVSVFGTFDERTTSQTWFYDASDEAIISVTALSDFDTATDLDLQVRILDAIGTEIAAIDNDERGVLFNPLDAQLINVALPQAGTYRIVVDSVFGSGDYSLSLATRKTLDLVENSVGQGNLSEASPLEQWAFNGQSGQIITITLLPADESLDPSMRLLSPQGEVVIENNDAVDDALFPGAQIVDFQLPSTGEYIIEALRFFGDGGYILSVTTGE